MAKPALEQIAGLYDTDAGIVFKVPGDDWYRVHITPQGEVRTGNGTAPPVPVGGGGIAAAQVKGDTLVASGAGVFGRLAAGSNGQILTPDSSTALGVKWAFASALGVQINVDIEYGAVGDGRISTGTMTSGSATLTRGSASFTFAATDVGKSVMVKGAGPGGATLVSTISAFINTVSVTLADAASTSVTAQLMAYGTDNTTALNNAYSSPAANYNTYEGKGVTFIHPGNTYLCFGEIELTNVVNTCWQGRGGPGASFTGGSDAVGSRVCYVGSGERFLTIDYANNIAMRGMQWEYCNPDFTGDLIQIAANGTINPQTQPAQAYFGRCMFQGRSAAFKAGMLLNTGQTLPVEVDHCTFRYATRAIHNGGDYPVIQGCGFYNTTKPPIVNLRQVSVIRDCVFTGLMTSAGVVNQGGAGAYERLLTVGRSVTDGAITTSPGSPTGRRLTSATANFVESDLGAVVTVTGAGVGGATLTTQIAQVVSVTEVMLAQGARTTVSGATVTTSSDSLQAVTFENNWCGDSTTATGSWVTFRGASLVVKASQLAASSASAVKVVGGAGAVNAVSVTDRSNLKSEGGAVGIDVTGTLFAPMLLLGVIFPAATPIANEASVPAITALGCENYTDRAPGLPGAPLFARSTSNQVLTQSSTTLQDVTGVSVPVVANGVYEVAATFIYSATTTADIKVGFTAPGSGTAFTWTAQGPAFNASATPASILMDSKTVAQPVEMGAFGTSATTVVKLSGLLVVGSVAGTFQMQAAQRTAEASDATVYAGTRMILEKVT